MRSRSWSFAVVSVIVSSGACHSSPARPDAADAPVDAPADAAVDAAPPPDVAQLVRVQGHVDYDGPVAGATVTTLGDAPQTTPTDGSGDFYFDVYEGSRLIMEATATTPTGLIPLVRGVVAEDDLRPRIFYMLGPPDAEIADELGVTFDPSLAIVEVDFRNAAIGGYSVTLTGSDGSAIVPAFGIVSDDSGSAALGIATIAGGDGSTLLLGGLPPGDVSFTAIVPGSAALPCHPDDANPLPLVAGAATWFDFECGSGTD